MTNTSDLLKRYNQPAPRYTSYPTAPHWRTAHNGLLHSALRHSVGLLSLYLHIPFCERLCLYCGCNVVVSKDHTLAHGYIDSLIREMDLASDAHGRLVTQVHWGGGTPTYLQPHQITTLFNAIVSRFTISANAERSIEIDPRVTRPDHLDALRTLGFNRLSVGIQDFDQNVQMAVRRMQSFDQTRQLFEYARQLGFESVNADLIYGLPFQTRTSFANTLDMVVQLNPDRLAVFSYAHVPTIKHQQRAYEKHLPSDAEKLQLFLDAAEMLTSNGYEHVGMDHFARPTDALVEARNNGTLHRNFQGYTTHAGIDLLGFGVSAISDVGQTFTQNVRELWAYEDAVGADRLPVFRGYVQRPDDVVRSTVIEECLCNGAISKDRIESLFGIDFDRYFEPELSRLADLESDGLIEGATSRTIGVTPTGRIFVRTIAKVFDAFEPAAVASQAV